MYTGLYDITDIDESIQGNSGIMPPTKKGKLWVKVHQVDRTEWVHIVWHVKFFPKAGANLFLLTCKLSQGNKIAGVYHNNIVVNTLNGNIIFDCWIKTHKGWVARVKFLHKANNEKAVSYTALPKKNINDLHIELGYLSKTIIHATTKVLASKSLVHSNHVNIVPWVRPSSAQSEKRLYLIQKFWGKGFSLI